MKTEVKLLQDNDVNIQFWDNDKLNLLHNFILSGSEAKILAHQLVDVCWDRNTLIRPKKPVLKQTSLVNDIRGYDKEGGE